MSDAQSTEMARTIAATLAQHRFAADRSQDGTLDHGWCRGGDAWATKHVSEHEVHLAEKIAAALDRAPNPPEQLGADQ